MKISITKDTLTPKLEAILAVVKRPRTLMEAAAKAVQRMISQHLVMLQARGNKRGWPSQAFFAGGKDSVERRVGVSSITDTSATITIADPRFVHRIQGGTVSAKRVKNLAIPLTAEAYAASGKGSIRDSMPGLKLVVLPRGLFLVREENERTTHGATGRRKFGRVQRVRIFPLFKLMRSVTHRPHPEEMPRRELLGETARAAMLEVALIRFKLG